jgi:hypothetical protein
MIRHAALLLMLCPAQAMAMNWEGHDDWMLDYGMADKLREALPHAKPLPSPDCPVTEKMASENPYEQIPLPRHRCPVPAGRATPQR